MKRIIAFSLVLILLLTGCAGKNSAASGENGTLSGEDAADIAATDAAAVETTEAPTEPTTVPTTEAPIIYRNPLNGEILDEPFTSRIFANTISNIPDALPHVGVNQADILMEMYVNSSIIRCLALYTDIESVDAIGSTRSTRLMFNDIAEHYSLILSHAGGSSFCLGDANDRGLAHYNIDSLMRQADPLAQGMAYRDKEYKYGEHNLFGIGSGIKAYAEAQGVPMTLEKDYGLTFTEDGTPIDGEIADSITVTFTYGKAKKDTVMTYDAELDKYVYNQYGQLMVDQITGETEAFTNVIIMLGNISHVSYSGTYYQCADFVAGGTGYYANGGKIIPITWTCDSETDPFRFFTADGEPLNLGVGNSYIAIASFESPIVFGAAEAPAETTEETTAG